MLTVCDTIMFTVVCCMSYLCIVSIGHGNDLKKRIRHLHFELERSSMAGIRADKKLLDLKRALKAFHEENPACGIPTRWYSRRYFPSQKNSFKS
jgi:hypothetical protein